MNNKREDAQ